MDLISIWAVVRWLHLLAAMVWVGGMIFMFIVLLPALRPVQPPVERTLLFARIGQRYATVSWVALLTLIVTGILNGERRRLDWLHLLDSEYGQTLHLKLELVGVTLLLTAVHAFTSAVASPPSPNEPARWGRTARKRPRATGSYRSCPAFSPPPTCWSTSSSSSSPPP